MFYIVEKESKLENLEKLVKLGCYVDVISSDYNFHPKLTSTVAVYLRLLNSQHGYIIPIEHSEGLNIDKTRVSTLLNKASKLYTLNKKELLYHFNVPSAIDLSLVHSMTNYSRLEYSKFTRSITPFYNRFREHNNINQLIPISKLYESCEELYNKVKELIDIEIPDGFDFYNNTATSVFYLLEQQGLGIHRDDFISNFKPREPRYNIEKNTVV